MGLPYPVANIASSAVFFLGVHVLARRQPDPLGFLVLLFPILIINMPMSGIRQGAAIGLLCIAFVAFIDRRPLWFAFWVVLAAGFHISVLIFMLLLPVATGSTHGTACCLPHSLQSQARLPLHQEKRQKLQQADTSEPVLTPRAQYFVLEYSACQPCISFCFCAKNGCRNGQKIIALRALAQLGWHWRFFSFQFPQ